MSSRKLMIIDGNSIMNRAFYGLQGHQLLSTSDGLYTNAIYGFINILHKYINEENPGYICVAFDLKAPTFRHKEFEEYKANRKGMPEELAVQMPVIKDVLDAMNVKRLEIEGYEADDIIGAVTLKAENSGYESIIITGDRDSLQLASNKTRIKIPSTRMGKTETTEYNYDIIKEKYGVTPRQMIDVKGLMGDKSDNIPGVPGIGEKTALELIKEFGSIDNMYNNIDKISKKSLKEKLINNKELAYISRKLAEIVRNIPDMDINIEDFVMVDYDREKLYQLFKRLEFKSFIEKFGLEEGKKHECLNCDVNMITCNDDIMNLKTEIKNKGKFALYYLIDKIGDHQTKLQGMAVCFSDNICYYADLIEKINEEVFLNAFKEIFEDNSIKKYGHDIKNLILYLKQKGIEIRGISFDTMVAAYLLNPSRDTYTVSELAEEYIGVAIDPIENLIGKGKNFKRFSEIEIDKLSVSACEHSNVIFRLVNEIDSKIAENSQHELYYDIELPLIEVLASMEYYGFKVNTEELKAFSAELEDKINALMGEIYNLAGEEFNINSTKQLGTVLFEKLGLPPVKKTKTGYSTDAEVLEQLSSKHEIVQKILDYRQLVKLKSTYVEGLLSVINPHTGKIHSSFNQTVTATGRISSTEPNLQNIPIKIELGRKIRKVFIPESEDYILLDADYSQIELRVLAHITGDENMIRAFQRDEDIHTSTASQVFGISPEEVTSLMRSRAKAVNFGIIYGIGDFSLSKDLGITRKQAREYINQYLNKYPKVKEYMHNIVQYGKENGFVTTLFNRRRYLPELTSSNFNIRSFSERVALNTPIQGTAADIIKIAMVKVHNELKSRNLKSRLILQVHDELLIETHKSEEETVKKLLKDSMEKAVKLLVPLKVEVKRGNNWYETK